jgi:translation initiation factor IF-2
VVVYEGKLGSLRRFKDDVKEVQAGYECGMSIDNFNDVKPGDRFEVYTLDKVLAKL